MAEVIFDHEVPGWGRAQPRRLVLSDVGITYGEQSLAWAEITVVGFQALVTQMKAAVVVTVSSSGQYQFGFRAADRELAVRLSAAQTVPTKKLGDRSKQVQGAVQAMNVAMDRFLLPRLGRDMMQWVHAGHDVAIGGDPVVKPKGTYLVASLLRSALQPQPIVANRNGLAIKGLVGGTKLVPWPEVGSVRAEAGQIHLHHRSGKRLAKLWTYQENAVVLPALIDEARAQGFAPAQ
jgi:hypothetical protein